MKREKLPLTAAGDGKGDEMNKDLFVLLAYLCVAA